jgi:hypothetical protein
MKPAGRFRVVAGRFGGTEETDGIAVMPGSFGEDYPPGCSWRRTGTTSRRRRTSSWYPGAMFWPRCAKGARGVEPLRGRAPGI